MGITKHARRGLAVIAAGGLGAGLLVSSGVAPAAAAAALTLDYTCTYPLINQQDLTVDITVDLPAEAQVGVPTAPFDIEAINTISANTTSGLALIGAKTLEGTAVSHVNVQAPQVNLPDVQVPVTVHKVNVPASGAFEITATGETPSLTFPEVGEATIDLGILDLRMIARNAAGDPIALPGGNPDGSFNAPCTPKPGQNQRLAAFPIVGDPPPNTPPVANDVTAETATDTAVDITLDATDAEGDPLTYAAADPAHGTVSVTGDVATYTPDAGFTGTDTFDYTAADAEFDDTATVTVTVSDGPSNTPPVAADVTGATTASKPVALTLAGSDADGDALTYAATGAANGSLSFAGDQATYTPDDGFVGTDTFTYSVSDGLAEATADVTVEVAKAPTTTKARPVTRRAKIGKPLKVRVVTTAPALTPTGKVLITRKGKVVARGTLSDGKAVLTIRKMVTKKLKKGRATFVVKYAGSPVTTRSKATFSVRMVK